MHETMKTRLRESRLLAPSYRWGKFTQPSLCLFLKICDCEKGTYDIELGNLCSVIEEFTFTNIKFQMIYFIICIVA